MTHSERIAHALKHKTCFACANYCGQFSLLSAPCLTGGLNPEHTAAAPDPATARIRSGVRWANSCSRFVAAHQQSAAA